MKVTCRFRNDPERDLTSPLLRDTDKKFVWRIYSGQINDPVQIGGNWFTPPYPTKVWKKVVNWPILPFFSWKWPFTTRGGYIGFKLYGVDAEAYKNWMNPADVYPGSQALCLSFRPFASLEKK